MHIIRAGLSYNLELRLGWRALVGAGVANAEGTSGSHAGAAMGACRRRIHEHQFRRETASDAWNELNAIARIRPCSFCNLYDRALLNGAALRAVGYNKATPNPLGGEIVRDRNGNPTGLLLAQPNASILYSTLAERPEVAAGVPEELQSSFMREVNRLVSQASSTPAVDSELPEDYRIIEELHAAGELTVRIAYNLFTQKPREELADFRNWADKVKPGQGDDLYRHNGAGEMLVYSAADFEDFRVARPDLFRVDGNGFLEPVVRLLAERRWPWRLHATYDETISRALDVFEKVNRDVPLDGLHWFLDHCETISDRNIDRVAALGGGIAIQASHGVPGRVLRRALRPGRRGTHAAYSADAEDRHSGGRRDGWQRVWLRTTHGFHSRGSSPEQP